jgi:hypothetical protein
MAHTAGSKLFPVDLALDNICQLRAVRATSYLLVRDGALRQKLCLINHYLSNEKRGHG